MKLKNIEFFLVGVEYKQLKRNKLVKMGQVGYEKGTQWYEFSHSYGFNFAMLRK